MVPPFFCGIMMWTHTNNDLVERNMRLERMRLHDDYVIAREIFKRAKKGMRPSRADRTVTADFENLCQNNPALPMDIRRSVGRLVAFDKFAGLKVNQYGGSCMVLDRQRIVFSAHHLAQNSSFYQATFALSPLTQQTYKVEIAASFPDYDVAFGIAKEMDEVLTPPVIRGRSGYDCGLRRQQIISLGFPHECLHAACGEITGFSRNIEASGTYSKDGVLHNTILAPGMSGSAVFARGACIGMNIAALPLSLQNPRNLLKPLSVFVPMEIIEKLYQEAFSPALVP